MPAPSSDQQIVFLTNLQRLLGEGSFVSTYKYCLLMALADLSIELGRDDDSGLTLSTSQIAEKFIQYYWRQSAPYIPGNTSGLVLQQNPGKQAAIINLIQICHTRFQGSLSEARHDQLEWKQLVSKVASIVQVMPLWKLQTVGSDQLDFLYQNVGKGRQITLNAGVAYCLRKYHPFVSDMVKGAWSRYIRRFNGAALGDRADLNEFLFGSERANLNVVKPILEDFQSGECFYCQGPLKGLVAHVDHFIPWSRYSVDLGHNFVLAHATCNGNKSDRLASSEHLEAWAGYQGRNAKALATEFDRAGVLNDFGSSVRIVDWAYTQTFVGNGLTWFRADELQRLPSNWKEALAAFTIVA